MRAPLQLPRKVRQAECGSTAIRQVDPGVSENRLFEAATRSAARRNIVGKVGRGGGEVVLERFAGWHQFSDAPRARSQIDRHQLVTVCGEISLERLNVIRLLYGWPAVHRVVQIGNVGGQNDDVRTTGGAPDIAWTGAFRQDAFVPEQVLEEFIVPLGGIYRPCSFKARSIAGVVRRIIGVTVLFPRDRSSCGSIHCPKRPFDPAKEPKKAFSGGRKSRPTKLYDQVCIEVQNKLLYRRSLIPYG
jgi:hypothetical protein